MKKIDTSKWKEFVVGDLFDIHPTKAYKRINIELFEENGTNPVIVNTGFNNGVGGYANLDCTEKAGTITFTDTAAKSTDSFFYQEKDFIGYPHVQGMYAKTHEWTRTEGLFLNAVIKSILNGRYDFIRKMTRAEILQLKVKLPAVVQMDGTYRPDWAFMDAYMSRMLQISEANLATLRQADGNKHTIDITKWKRFHLYDEGLFEIDMGTKLDRVKMTQTNPEINFVGRANTNNGITARVDRLEELEPYDAGNMTLSLGGDLGSCFIQPDRFYTSQNVVVLIPKWKMPFEVKQFIATMIFRESKSYYKPFINELNPHIKTDFSFFLPVDTKEKPDWKYMENYMQSIIKNAELDLRAIQTVF